MKIVVGLGNPGERYARTPHNVGFLVLDEMARRLACTLKRSLRFQANVVRAALGSEQVLLVKPQTYMNNSGSAVGAVLRFWKQEPRDLVVVLDDADIEAGRLRVRGSGGSGGHRGLASIIQELGTEAFPRVRVGIGRAQDAPDLVDHVLAAYTDGELAAMAPAIRRAADAVETVVTSGPDKAMNAFNARPSEPKSRQESGS